MNNCIHDWIFTGYNQSQVKAGDQWPNKFYKCSKCGQTKIDRSY